MKLKRPPITIGPWYATDEHVQSAVLDEDNYVCEAEGSTEEEVLANAEAIAALPEAMDRLEELYASFPTAGEGWGLNEVEFSLWIRLQGTMLKMGYTQEEEIPTPEPRPDSET